MYAFQDLYPEIISRFSPNDHWTKMTSSLNMLVVFFADLSQTMCTVFIVNNLIFHHMSLQIIVIHIDEINSSEHHKLEYTPMN